MRFISVHYSNTFIKCICITHTDSGRGRYSNLVLKGLSHYIEGTLQAAWHVKLIFYVPVQAQSSGTWSDICSRRPPMTLKCSASTKGAKATLVTWWSVRRKVSGAGNSCFPLDGAGIPSPRHVAPKELRLWAFLSLRARRLSKQEYNVLARAGV